MSLRSELNWITIVSKGEISFWCVENAICITTVSIYLLVN